MNMLPKLANRKKEEFRFTPSALRSEGFWGIARLTEAQLEPIKKVLNRYVKVCAQYEAECEKFNQSVKQDLKSLLKRHGQFTNAVAHVSSADTNLYIGFSLLLDVRIPEIRIQLDLPEDQRFSNTECASQILRKLKTDKVCRPLALMFESQMEIFIGAINIDFERNQQMRTLKPAFVAAIKDYHWADTNIPLELDALIDDFDLSLKAVKDSLFVRKPQADSKFELLSQAYLKAVDSRHIEKSSLYYIPLYSSEGTEEALIDILKITSLLSPLGKIPYEPYSRERMGFLVEQAAPLLDNLNGLPLPLSTQVRSVFAAYVFGGLRCSGISRDINYFSDREFKGLLENQIIFPRNIHVRQAEGDDPELAKDSFNALMEKEEHYRRLLLIF